MWTDGVKSLPSALQEMVDDLSSGRSPDGIGVTMTAELSDAFRSKREGIQHVLEDIRRIFSGNEPRIADFHGDLGSIESAIDAHLRYASANWAATAKILAGIFSDCILIDVGSTTTDIIPVLNHRITSKGLTDLERLATGELVYTGALRSGIPSITHSLPIKGRETAVADERFALSADIHLILGNISQEDYSTETADGRDRSRQRCFERLARTVCADPETIGEPELIQMASFIRERQVEKIRFGLEKVLRGQKIRPGNDLPVVTTGIGGVFMGQEAGRRSGFRRFSRFEDIVGAGGTQAAAAVSVALLVAAEMGEMVRWSSS
jgi:probable H4MPT-linked C1 transfer pathway protein